MSHPPAETRCQHKDGAKRQCRMPRISEFITLCPTHARQALLSLDQATEEPMARKILGTIRDLRTGAALNHALGNLFVLTADGRISARRAVTLGYLGQLLAQTLPQINKERWYEDQDASLKEAMHAALLGPVQNTPAAKFAQAVFRRALGEEQSEAESPDS